MIRLVAQLSLTNIKILSLTLGNFLDNMRKQIENILIIIKKSFKNLI